MNWTAIHIFGVRQMAKMAINAGEPIARLAGKNDQNHHSTDGLHANSVAPTDPGGHGPRGSSAILPADVWWR